MIVATCRVSLLVVIFVKNVACPAFGSNRVSLRAGRLRGVDFAPNDVPLSPGEDRQQSILFGVPITMSRWSAALNAVLTAVVLIQAAMLYGRDPLSGNDRRMRSPVSATSERSIQENEGNSREIEHRLAAIDAKLAAMKSAAHISEPVHAATDETPAVISPQAMSIAERRFSALVTDKEFGHEDRARFHGVLSQLPADEQIALIAAMTRAVNAHRVKPGL
jgi:hypothetical protein